LTLTFGQRPGTGRYRGFDGEVVEGGVGEVPKVGDNEGEEAERGGELERHVGEVVGVKGRLRRRRPMCTTNQSLFCVTLETLNAVSSKLT